MRILLIHCDFFSYLTTGKTKEAEKIEKDCKSCAVKDALVVLVTSEEYDAKNPEKVSTDGAKKIDGRAKQLGVRNISIFPFVHLSDKISDSGIAMKVMNGIQENLEEFGYSVDKAPFGWEKVFSLTSKGHPLAESSMTIRP